MSGQQDYTIKGALTNKKHHIISTIILCQCHPFFSSKGLRLAPRAPKTHTPENGMRAPLEIQNIRASARLPNNLPRTKGD